MLKIAYIATSEPIVKPKKLTEKQSVAIEAQEALPVLNHINKNKALAKYADRIKALEKRTAYLNQLRNER